MKNIIRIGDKTTGGDTVLSGSTVMNFRGIGARPGGLSDPRPWSNGDCRGPSSVSRPRHSGRVSWASLRVWLHLDFFFASSECELVMPVRLDQVPAPSPRPSQPRGWLWLGLLPLLLLLLGV